MKGIVALILGLMLAPDAGAQTLAKVRSGEHPGFTRLVIDAAASEDWALVRAQDGYDLRLTTGEWRFDVSSVFDRVAKDRLAGIWVDPAHGGLHLDVACACHATAFRLPSGQVVIDIQDGPPASVSPFERAADGREMPPLAARSGIRPAPLRPPDSYDWTVMAQASRPDQAVPETVAPPLRVTDPSMIALRDSLLAQLGDGMARGMVDRAAPGQRAPASSAQGSRDETARVSIGDLPGIVAGSDRPAPGGLTAAGTACIADDRLALQDWGGDTDAAEAIAASRHALLAEFDHPDPDAVLTHARVLIHFGFGAEAEATLRAFAAPGGGDELALLHDLSRHVDGRPVDGGTFAGMSACSGNAALWALLSSEGRDPGADVAAISRGFSGLPGALRQSLGPRLVQRLEAAGRAEAVPSVMAAIERLAGADVPEVAAVSAGLSLAAGDADQAIEKAEAVLQQPARATADATIALVEGKVSAGQAVDPAIVTTLEALIREHQGDSRLASLQRALTLALAASGNPVRAVTEAPQDPATIADLWRVIAEQTADSDLLKLAVLGDGVVPEVTDQTADRVASRLVTLGFPDAALQWLGPPEQDWAEGRRMTAARAELARGDGRAAGRLLAGIEDSEAEALRAEALTRLGDPALASAAWARAGDAVAADRALIWSQDWAKLSEAGPAVWQAATAAAPPSGGGDGLLGKSSALAAQSARDRAAFAQLLREVGAPSAP